MRIHSFSKCKANFHTFCKQKNLPFIAHARSRNFLAAVHNVWLAKHPSLAIVLFERKNLLQDLDRVAARSLTIQNAPNIQYRSEIREHRKRIVNEPPTR